jgi:anti-anti-sigma factor
MSARGPVFHLEVTHGEDAGARAIRMTVEGELDSASSRPLLDAFAELASEERAPALTLDLTGVQFIDSTGLRALIEIEHEARRHEVPLTVLPAPEAVTEILRVAGVADRLRLVNEGAVQPSERDFLERADVELPLDKHAPSQARATVRELLGEALAQPVLASIVLMTSELVTNAVTHPGIHKSSASVGLRVVVFPGRVRVEVDDPGPGFRPGDLSGQENVEGFAPGGRGLFVVDHSATRWGTRHLENERGRRFSVWFELETA